MADTIEKASDTEIRIIPEPIQPPAIKVSLDTLKKQLELATAQQVILSRKIADLDSKITQSTQLGVKTAAEVKAAAEEAQPDPAPDPSP